MAPAGVQTTGPKPPRTGHPPTTGTPLRLSCGVLDSLIRYTLHQREARTSIFFGLDAGTTSMSAVALEAASGEVLGTVSLPNDAARSPAAGRSELDLDALTALATRALRTLRDACGHEAGVAGIGVTGQMHGLALLGLDGRALAPAITWQDARSLDVAGGGETHLARFVRLAGGPAAFCRAGCLPAAGYTGVLLHALAQGGALPTCPAVACTIPDALVSALCGCPPHTDPSDAASTGLYDVPGGCWDVALVERVGLEASLLPPVRQAGQPAGGLLPGLAAASGLRAGLPVTTALGDNQASFLGSVRRPRVTLLANVGTGAQVSAWMPAWVPPDGRPAGLEVRPFPGGGYLLVGAELCGGASLAALADLFSGIGRDLFGSTRDASSLYPRLVELAAKVPTGADGLRLGPWFTGSRRDAARRATLSGLATTNLTAGHLTRALFEGLAEALGDLAADMTPILATRRTPAPRHLVGAGNALRLNAVLRSALSERLGLPVELPACAEPAAAGAGLLAAVGCGALPTVQDAMARVRSVRRRRPE